MRNLLLNGVALATLLAAGIPATVLPAIAQDDFLAAKQGGSMIVTYKDDV